MIQNTEHGKRIVVEQILPASKDCMCGRSHRKGDLVKRIIKVGIVTPGFWFNCECKSTLLVLSGEIV